MLLLATLNTQQEMLYSYSSMSTGLWQGSVSSSPFRYLCKQAQAEPIPRAARHPFGLHSERGHHSLPLLRYCKARPGRRRRSSRRAVNRWPGPGKRSAPSSCRAHNGGSPQEPPLSPSDRQHLDANAASGQERQSAATAKGLIVGVPKHRQEVHHASLSRLQDEAGDSPSRLIASRQGPRSVFGLLRLARVLFHSPMALPNLLRGTLGPLLALRMLALAATAITHVVFLLWMAPGHQVGKGIPEFLLGEISILAQPIGIQPVMDLVAASLTLHQAQVLEDAKVLRDAGRRHVQLRREPAHAQRIVATLGKLPGLDKDERAGWEEITRLLDGRARDSEQADLFRTTPEPPQWAQVNLSDVRVERVRQFGPVYLALALWRRLGLHSFFAENVREGRERID